MANPKEGKTGKQTQNIIEQDEKLKQQLSGIPVSEMDEKQLHQSMAGQVRQVFKIVDKMQRQGIYGRISENKFFEGAKRIVIKNLNGQEEEFELLSVLPYAILVRDNQNREGLIQKQAIRSVFVIEREDKTT